MTTPAPAINRELVENLLGKAKRHWRNRQLVWSWKSTAQDLETLEHTGEPVGVLILLEIEHDSRSKAYRADLRKVHWQTSGSGIMVTIYSPFVAQTYPSVRLSVAPTNRYSDKGLNAFAERILKDLPYTCDANPYVLGLITEANNLR